ncbi:RNA polymerase sigma factor [Spongiivirga citrea]|uniref:Sigma-70 family RNA polymerase sigma factor n=1 Tax=Spongiivirga citrea TaxID=1481457 RepID=A0A6M0CJQ6_9FLAO|nr:sigma-70 family RNA polymerase sigma factor [Spongiivirga citrea]NER18071.1 sigma-70 family RNA polymerase sigma factor [Spongiivirga citrea]
MSKQDAQLFESIYKDHYPMVYQMCLGYMKGDSAQAGDLTQEIFIIIWNKLSSFEGKSTLKTWIYRITVNSCLQYLRKQKRKRSIQFEKIEGVLKNEPTEEVDTKNQSLYAAIGKLNEIDRLLIMMILDGETYDGVAEVIGISVVNVRVKIHRIKQRLKKILENE